MSDNYLEMFVPVGKCVPQGAEEFEEHSKLCTSCHGVYVLDKLCFPRFINAIRCESGTQTSGCIFDKISTQGMIQIQIKISLQFEKNL